MYIRYVCFFTLCTFLFLLGCNRLPVKQDYDEAVDFSSLKTFTWQTKQQENTGDILVDSSLLDDRIRAAIERTLMAKGFSQTTEQEADFYVAYHYRLDEKMDRNTPYTHIEIGNGRHIHDHSTLIGVSHHHKEYTENLLVIDIINAHSAKLIWRGMLERRLRYSNEPSKTTQYINATVAAILEKFPPYLRHTTTSN